MATSTPALSSPGLGSGLDINGLVSKLMQVESQPLAALTTKEVKDQAKLTAFGTIKSGLSNIQSAVNSLSNAYQFLGTNTSVSDSEALSATSVSTASLITHSVSVTQLAQSHRISSGTFASADAVIGTGTINLQLGSIQSDSTPPVGLEADGTGNYTGGDISFIPNGNKSAATITIDSTKNTLSGVRDAINAANAGVTASIINNGSGFQLVVASNDSGAKNAISMTISGDGDGEDVDTAGLSQLSFDPTADTEDGQNMTQVSQARSALVTVDGIKVTSDSNTLSDAIPGVSLTVKKITTAAASLTVSRDTTSASKSIDAFVKAYNDLNKSVKDLTSYDSTTKRAATLQGESVVRSIQNQIRSTISSVLPSGTYTSFSQVGITFAKDGSLAYDASKFNSAVSKDAASVAALFGEYGAPTDSQVKYISASTATKPGNYGVAINQIATQSNLEADNPDTFDVLNVPSGQTDTMFLSVNGIASGAIGFSEADYSLEPSDFAALMQSRINGDTSLKASGATVSVGYNQDTLKFSIISNMYGSKSVIDLSSISTFLSDATGLTVKAASAGRDVEGTIGDRSATGSGQYLTGSGNAEGLKLQITGGNFDAVSSAPRGTVNYNRGIAYQLSAMIGQMLKTDGILSSRLDGINNDIKDIGKQRATLNQRLTDIEARYRKQFTALDTTISQLQSTSTYLTQQLANISRNNNSN